MRDRPSSFLLKKHAPAKAQRRKGFEQGFILTAFFAPLRELLIFLLSSDTGVICLPDFKTPFENI
jgi:hypothetical protein